MVAKAIEGNSSLDSDGGLSVIGVIAEDRVVLDRFDKGIKAIGCDAEVGTKDFWACMLPIVQKEIEDCIGFRDFSALFPAVPRVQLKDLLSEDL